MDIYKPTNYSCATVYKLAKSEIDRVDFAIGKQPKETLESYYRRNDPKPDLLFNGGFFNMANGGTIFTYVDEGAVHSYAANLVEGIGIKNKELVLGSYSSEYTDFVSGYPVLVRDGRAVSSNVGSEIDYKARRTLLGYNATHIFVITIELPGYKFSDCKNLLISLGVTNAINLDGGGSTRLLLNGVRKTSTIYSRPIDNMVAIYLKKAPAVIYRVQTGAFSKKPNADAYLAKIKAIPDTISAGYKNAYIRVINGLYKVQVGAFTKKENAEKVLNDLKSKGFDAFITT